MRPTKKEIQAVVREVSDLTEQSLRRRVREKQTIIEEYRKARDFWFERYVILEAKYNKLVDESASHSNVRK